MQHPETLSKLKVSWGNPRAHSVFTHFSGINVLCCLIHSALKTVVAYFLPGFSFLFLVSGMMINPVPGTLSCVEAEVSKEVFVPTLGIKDTIYIQQNKPIFSFQINFPNINGLYLHST